MKEKKTVILGVSSGIAAYKSVELVTLLKKENLDVFVILTKNALQMIDVVELEKVSGNKVYVELFEENFKYQDILKQRKVDHIEIADKAAVFVIAPATANTIAKIAHGFADNFLLTSLLATTAPIIICPSMNVHMWENPSVQENIAVLKKRGMVILNPEEGELACGYTGKGRLVHLEKIKQEVLRRVHKSESLIGKKIIITAGGTKEKIDDVRFIANRSSGKMGVALAEECFLRGADVLLVRSKSSITPRYKIKEELFETTDELFKILQKEIKKNDIIFHTAAVSDFTVKKQIGKISSDNNVLLQMTPQKKILDEIKKINPKIKLIAFKAEWNVLEKDLIKISKKKLKEANADVIVANDVGQKNQGFEVDTNEVFLVFKNGTHKKITLDLKQTIARSMIDLLIDVQVF